MKLPPTGVRQISGAQQLCCLKVANKRVVAAVSISAKSRSLDLLPGQGGTSVLRTREGMRLSDYEVTRFGAHDVMK